MQILQSQFLLKPGLVFLNFGSFGACVKPVFEKYQALQREMELDPVDFITNTGLNYLKQSKQSLAAYLHCPAEDLVYITNPTYAVNMVAKSFPFKPGDEILTTALEYGACDKTWEFYCEKKGMVYKKQPISIPITSKEALVDDFFKGLSPKTKMVFISHVTSSTALRLPVEEICAKAKQLGLVTFVDGAHAPGQVNLDLSTLQADIYTGACHKWMMTPKGSSFVYVKKELQHFIDPLIISWGYKALFPSSSTFQDHQQLIGTRDYTAYLTIPSSLEFMEQYNWPMVTAQCRTLTMENAGTLCNLLDAVPIAPVNDDFTAQMYSAEIKTREPEKLHDLLLETYHIQVPVMRHGAKTYLRYSIHAFNEQQDLDHLFNAVKDIKSSSSLIE
ncbi:MAG: aminotransferase class V-fold PLP-dependent enzyme [Ferruginibacter sp.]